MSAVVGLIGKKRSGKDTFAGTLVEEFGFRRFAFADPLKESLLAVDPIVLSYITFDEFLDPEAGFERLSSVVSRLGWEEAKDAIPEVRRLLQEYGVGIRGIQEDFWVRATLDPALRCAASGTPVVVTDVRFPNEADEIRDAGGVIVRIVRPGQDESDSHASENALNDYLEDLTVYNGGTVADLAEQARALPKHPLVTL